jgi:hypothetical protein
MTLQDLGGGGGGDGGAEAFLKRIDRRGGNMNGGIS